VEEQIVVGSCEIVTGRTAISKKVEEREEVIDLSLSAENCRAERIPINLTVDNHESGNVTSGGNLSGENVRPTNDDYGYTCGRTLAADPRLSRQGLGDHRTRGETRMKYRPQRSMGGIQRESPPCLGEDDRRIDYSREDGTVRVAT
jgi:hypothetical protein